MCRGAVQVCPLQGKCLTNEVVATEVETSTEEKDTYTGLTGGQLKTRYTHHMGDFRHVARRYSTTFQPTCGG